MPDYKIVYISDLKQPRHLLELSDEEDKRKNVYHSFQFTREQRLKQIAKGEAVMDKTDSDYQLTESFNLLIDKTTSKYSPKIIEAQIESLLERSSYSKKKKNDLKKSILVNIKKLT